MELEEQDGQQTVDSQITEPSPTEERSREDILYGDDQPNPDEQSDQVSTQEAYNLSLPEGVQLDAELLATATPVLKDIGLTNEQANKLVPLVTQVQERIYSQQQDEFAVVRTSWARATKQDPEIGGAKLAETQRLVGVALKAGGAAHKTHEFRELMNESGLGDHPAALRLFRRLGQIIEGQERRDAAARRGPRSREQILYGD